MTTGIFPERLATAYVKHAGEKYRPSNGTEGECFFAAWCFHCQRDKAMREGANLEDCDDNERCDLIARSFAFEVTDAEYPTEWQYGKDGQPCCTAFIPAPGAALHENTGALLMNRLFDVVALDDNCTRWACQREIDCGIFETIGNFDSREDAQIECDRLNEDVEGDNAALEEQMALIYGAKGGAQ